MYFRSQYFRALLHGGLSESLATCVPLQVEATALRSLLAYLYTSRPGLATLDTNTLFHLLDTARMMCLTDLEAVVEEHIIQTVQEPGTLVQVLNLAVEFKLPNIIDVCFGRINDSLERDPSLSSLSPMAISLILKDQQIKATKDSLLANIVHSLLSSWLQLYEWQGLEEQKEFLTKVQQLMDPDFLSRMSQVGLEVLLEMATGVEGRQASTQGSGLESSFWIDGGKCSGFYAKELKKRVREALVWKERRKKFIGPMFPTLVL